MLDNLFSLEIVYVLSGLLLLVIAVFTFRDRGNPARIGTGLFWLILGLIFVFGSYLPAWLTGLLVVAMVAIDGLGKVRHGDYHEAPHEERVRAADRFGYFIFIPVLMIPLLTYGATIAFSPFVSAAAANALVFSSLGYASIVAAIVALAMTRERLPVLVDDGRRLADAIGAVVILPQLLASLGTLFKAAGVGTVIAGIVTAVVPADNLFVIVVVSMVSIALFTFIMGNSFAAFPVIMSGIGVPLLIQPFGADAALVGLLLLTGASCGTLCTPMAANFNMVPPALFEMRDQYGVIKFQAPFAGAMLVVHILLLYGLVLYLR